METNGELELLREVYGSWGRGAFTEGELIDPEVVFVTASPEGRTYKGLRGLWQGWHDFLTAWDDFRVEAAEFEPIGGGRYLVRCRLHGLGKGSGVPVVGEGWNLVHLRAGRIVRLEIHWDRAGALSAAEGAS